MANLRPVSALFADRVVWCTNSGKSVKSGPLIPMIAEPLWVSVGAKNIAEDLDYMLAGGFESELCEAWEARYGANQ